MTRQDGHDPARGEPPLLALMGTIGRNPRTAFLLIYALTLAINLAFGLAIKFRATPGALEADELEYYQMASQMLHGGLGWDARRTLAYPLVMAGIRRVHDGMFFLQVVMTAIFSLAPPMLYLLVRRLCGGWPGAAAAGLLGGLALACWPPSMFYGTSLYSEALALPLFLATLIALPCGARIDRGAGRSPVIGALVCGVLLGLTAHVRPMYLLFTPFLALVVWIEEGRLLPAVRRVVLVALGFCAAILPWSIVMTGHFGHPILLTSNGGETLAGGLNPALTRQGQSTMRVTGREVWTGPGKWIPIHLTGYLSPAELALPYDRKDALLQERTRSWIREHPLSAARIELLKIGYMWGVYGIGRDGRGQLLFGNVPTILLVVGALVTLVMWPRARRGFVRLWMVAVFVSAVALISWGSWRFRQPADAGLLAMVAIAFVHAMRERAGLGSAGRAGANPA